MVSRVVFVASTLVLCSNKIHCYTHCVRHVLPSDGRVTGIIRNLLTTRASVKFVDTVKKIYIYKTGEFKNNLGVYWVSDFIFK